jgi:ribosomal protein L37E
MSAIMKGDCIVTIEMPSGIVAHGKASSFCTKFEQIETTSFGDTQRLFIPGMQKAEVSFTLDSLHWQNSDSLLKTVKSAIEWKCDYCGKPNAKKKESCSKCGAPRSFIYES